MSPSSLLASSYRFFIEKKTFLTILLYNNNNPPPLNTPAAMLAMARAGVKLTREQLKGLSGSDRKAAKKARKETKKVGSGAG